MDEHTREARWLGARPSSGSKAATAPPSRWGRDMVRITTHLAGTRNLALGLIDERAVEIADLSVWDHMPDGRTAQACCGGLCRYHLRHRHPAVITCRDVVGAGQSASAAVSVNRPIIPCECDVAGGDAEGSRPHD